MAVQERLYTADELWELSRGEDARHYELDEGQLVEMSPTGDAHGIVANWIAFLITAYVDKHNLGEVTAAETGFTLSTDPDVVRAPDVAFIAKARLTPITGKFYPFAPDLAVEVVSPGDTAHQIRRKTAQFLHAGTRLIWVVYPDQRLVDVYRPDHDSTSYENVGTLDGFEMLPGLNLDLKEVFKKLRA
jgi:Uma2 family endonuclease